MPNKQLTAKVRINTKDAEVSLQRLANKIKQIENFVNKNTNSKGLEKQIEKRILQEEKLQQATLKTKTAEEKLTTQKEKTKLVTEKVKKATIDTQAAEQRLEAATARTKSILDKVSQTKSQTHSKTTGIVAKVREWLSAQRQVHQSAKSTNSVFGAIGNKLKWLASTYLGVMGIKAVTGTSDIITSAENRLNNLAGGNPEQTAKTMDKIYSASQRARSGYTEMMANVSKTMTLAGDAFGGSIDNAIRFQEIMAKSYTIGGASAAEQASSMYQLVQALGSGILQGDELRSVREGAPIAYKEIEKFAQGVFKTEESLKELASQGKITSELVVAAIMNAEEKIEESFKNTKITFAQAFNNIKNVAVKSFEPILQMLNDGLNSEAGQNIVNGIGVAIQFLAQVLGVVFRVVSGIYNFIVTNWATISKVILTIVTVIAVALLPKLFAYLNYLTFVIMAHIYWGAVAVASAIKTAATWLLVHWQLALLLIILAAVVIAIIWVADSFVDACGIVVGSIYFVGAVLYNIVMFMINIIAGFVNAIWTMAENIGIAFYNAWQSAKASFWEWVQDCLNGSSMIAKAVSKIASVFGLDAVSIDTKINAARGKMKEYNSTEDILAGFTIAEYKNPFDSYQNGYKKGSSGAQWLTDKVSGLGDSIKNKLGIDMSALPGANDPSYSLDPYNSGNLADKLGGIKGDTGSIADSMELTQEDLEFLRRIADMEWKKEYTTAEIKVDMTNYNQVNGDTDLDGLVTKLTDKLNEELNVVANGVYVY